MIPGRTVKHLEENKASARKKPEDSPKEELVLTDRQIKYQTYWAKNKDQINERRRAKYKAHPRFKHPDRAAQKAQYWKEFWVKNKDKIMEKRRAAKIRK
jgi:hypothetical protein